MDTSEQYIKMCEKVVEIQALRGYEDGDVFWEKNEKQIHIWREGDGLGGHTCYSGIWLPRQDQLQEMLGGFGDASNLLIDFVEDVQAHRSFEQFWFSLVMQEKYNKVWNGEDWK